MEEDDKLALILSGLLCIWTFWCYVWSNYGFYWWEPMIKHLMER